MLKKKKLIFALFLIACILISMSFVSANNITDIDDLSNKNHDESIVENRPTKSFTDLKKEIYDLNKTEIILKDNYVNQKEETDYKDYYPHGDINLVITTGILINRSICIDGQGHVIDANNLSEIFYLNADNITLKNIIFKNARGINFGAVFCNASNISISNCTFINNDGLSAGAIYCNNPNILIINSTFINNTAYLGAAAVWCQSSNCTIINSTFFDNYITGYGGKKHAAIYYYDVVFNVVDETIAYSENSDKVKDIVFGKCIIINSTFKNTPTHEIHYNRTFILIFGNDTDNTNTTDSFDNSSDVNTTNNTELDNTTDDDKPNTSTNITNNETLVAHVPSNNIGNETDIIKPVNTSEKTSSIVVAKNKVFNKKLKTKLYPVVLKCREGNALKNALITLKIKGKLFKAKTNNKGKVTFKITKLNKKGKYKAKIKFKGNKKYNPVSKKVNIKVK